MTASWKKKGPRLEYWASSGRKSLKKQTLVAGEQFCQELTPLCRSVSQLTDTFACQPRHTAEHKPAASEAGNESKRRYNIKATLHKVSYRYKKKNHAFWRCRSFPLRVTPIRFHTTGMVPRQRGGIVTGDVLISRQFYSVYGDRVEAHPGSDWTRNFHQAS